VGEDVIQRLFDKIDALKDQVTELSIKVGKIEAKLEEKEKDSNSIMKAFGWLVTTMIAVYAAFFRGGNG
jgi:seryl-tRNA synthetase